MSSFYLFPQHGHVPKAPQVILTCSRGCESWLQFTHLRRQKRGPRPRVVKRVAEGESTQ